MNYRQTLAFLLYDWLHVETLTSRPRFAEHSCETFDAVFDTCERIATEKFAPFNRLVDSEAPRTEQAPDGSLRVVLPKATYEARVAYVESGMLAAAQDEAQGGMQLPFVVNAAANSFFSKASISINSSLLTVGNANLLLAYGTELQKKVFVTHELGGRWAGTMWLSEPQAGSSLSDIATRAELEDAHDALGPRYRLKGNKMWISSGEHELTENIVHLVLAKIPGADGKLIPGVKGISLFIVPKKLVDTEGQLTGVRNDAARAGLNHKLGWRGTTNTLLNFGEGQFPVNGKPGAVGYLVGQPGDGLKCMFHMMNEARIGVGMGAVMLGMAGYEASLKYAKERLQGRPLGPAGKDASKPQVRLIEHADIRRMLLAQKAWCEGALALLLYCARLVDEQRTGTPEQAEEAHTLREILTPIAKSWPAENCLEANSLAIQIHGGYGYTIDFPVEQYWRDNRLNMIHEGAHGIQAIDLLGRKVRMQGGQALALLAERIRATAAQAQDRPDLSADATALRTALDHVLQATQDAWADADPAIALANAVPYMQAFGHLVIAWMWLDVALANARKADAPLAAGLAAAKTYFYHYDLPKIAAWLRVVEDRDTTCANLTEEAF
jgi:butyryl-CoA dehydrogenase